MGAVMRLASRPRRGLAGAVLLLLLGGGSAEALVVLSSSLSPAGSQPLGTVVTVAATLYSDTGYLARLLPTVGDNLGCLSYGGPTDPTGDYAILATDPSLVSSATTLTPTLEFAGFGGTSNTAYVEWQFTLTRTGTVTFSVLAYDDFFGVIEGCDFSRFGCFGAYAGYPTGLGGVCSLGTVTITSPLAGTAVLSPAASRPPGTVYPDDQVVLDLSITNTGADLTVRAVVAATMPVDSNAPAAPVTVPATPVLITGGSQHDFVWTYTVTSGAVAGQHLRFSTDAERSMAYSNSLYIAAAPLIVTATLYLDPDGAGILDTVPAGVTESIVDDEVWVVADITNTSGAYSVDVDPVVDVADNNNNGNPDFMATAARNPAPGPVTMSPFTTRRFIWKYKLDRADYYQACTGGFNDMGFTIRTRGQVVALDLPVEQSNISTAVTVPPVVQLGDTFTATLWVTNLEDRPVTLDASATPYLAPYAAGLVTVMAGPLPAGNRVIGAGQAAGFVFTLSASGSGSQPFGAGFHFMGPPGFDCFAAIQAQVFEATASVEVVAPSPFVPTLLTSTTFVNGLDSSNNTSAYPNYLLTLAVYNSTTCDSELDHITANDNTGDLVEAPYVGPSFFTTTWFTSSGCPTLPCTITGGTTVYFTATVQGSVGCGDIDWTGTMTGLWGPLCGSLPFSRPYTSAKIHLRQGADLGNPESNHPFLPKSSAVETQNFQLVLKVTPAGENPVSNFAVALQSHTDPGAAFSLVSAPVIPSTLAGCGQCYPNICPSAAQSFTWTFKADAKGSGQGHVWFTFTVSGNDPYDTSLTLSASTTGKFSILTPSVVTASVWTEPEMGVFTGCRANAILDAVVVGDTAMSLTVAGQPKIFLSSTDGGTALLAGLPTPITLLLPGDNFFTWTYTPSGGAGDLRFSASITAQEMTLWSPETSTAITSETYPVRPGVLTASVWTDRSVVTTAAGQTFLVVLRVQNTGNVPSDPAWSVTLSALPGGCGGSCTGIPAKWPILTATTFTDISGGLFGCGDSAYYYWTFSTTLTGEGCVVFSATLNGAIAGVPMHPGAASSCLTILPRPPAQARLVSVSPASVLPGGDFDVTVEVKNTGATIVQMFRQPLLLSFSSPDLSYLAPASPPAIQLAAYGGTSTFTAKVHVLDGAAIGTDSIGFAALPFTATDLSVKGSVPVDASPVQVTVSVIPASAMVEIQQNPWHPLKGPLPIRYVTPDGGKLVLKVYNLEGQLVKSLVDEDKAPGDYVAQWDGKNESGQMIASGIFLVRFESKGLKTTKKLAVIK